MAGGPRDPVTAGWPEWRRLLQDEDETYDSRPCSPRSPEVRWPLFFLPSRWIRARHSQRLHPTKARPDPHHTDDRVAPTVAARPKIRTAWSGRDYPLRRRWRRRTDR